MSSWPTWRSTGTRTEHRDPNVTTELSWFADGTWEDDEPGFELVMEIGLPVSKTDFRGTGASRRLACCCQAMEGEPMRCAVHTLRRQWRMRLRELGVDPDEWKASGNPLPEQAATAPLFPDNEGGVP